MTDYSELVKALRGLANGIWKNCEYTWFGGEEKVFADAAAAIEELQAEVNKAEKTANDYRTMYFAKHGDITIEKVRELDEKDCHFHSALIRLMYRRIGELEASEPHWVSAEEMMPMEGERVLAYTSHNVVEMVEIGQDECYTEEGTYYLLLIRYWMPLPKPPQEVQE